MALNRSKSRYAIKECSTCGSWYTKECCSIGNLNDQIIIPVPDSSVHCAVCGTPVDGPYCHGCTRIRMKFEKELFAYCVDNGVFQNFQDTPESSNDNTNVVNAPREPSVVDQDPGFSDVYQTPPVASMEMVSSNGLIDSMQTLDEGLLIPHNEKSIKLLLAEEKFLKIKQVVEEEQTQPEYLQELLQSLLTDLQILNEIQPLKQEIPNQIQKDQEEKSIAELLAEERIQKANQVLNEVQSPQEMRIQDLEIQKQQCLEEMKEWINELGIREYQKEEIDIDYRRKCEDKIYELKDKFNGLSIEIRKIIQEAEELRKSEARARSQKIIIDDDDDDLGFYAVHPNTIHTPVSQNVEPKDSLIMGDGNINTTPETETISVESLVSNPSESDDFSLGECNLFNIDDSYYEKSTSRLDHLAPISPEIVEVCVDNDDTDDDDDCDMPVCDESSPIFTIFSNPLFDSNENFSSDDESLFEEEIQKDEFNSFSNPLYDIDDEIITNEKSLLNRDSPIDSTKTDSIFDEFSFPRLPEEHNSENVDTIIESLSYSPIPVEDSDSLIEEIDLFLTSDDSMPRALRAMIRLGRVAVTNDFDVLNDVESFDSGEGENVDSLNVEEEDSFTFTIRSFLPFVTYPEVLPASYSTGSEDKVFNPGIFDKDAFKDKSSKELAPSKALLTLKIFDPPHPPFMDFNVTKAFFGFTFSLLKIFSKKFFEPGNNNATVIKDFGQLLWFNNVEGTRQFTMSIDGLQSYFKIRKSLILCFIEYIYSFACP
ncbi:hypothetical protein Tco_0116661 [Tanacetum coccineum]